MIDLLEGDCLAEMDLLADYGVAVDAVVSDPPYHLASIVKRFGKPGSAPAKDRDGAFKRASRGFMGKEWDGGDIAFQADTWARVFALLKPGGYLLAFGGSRTYHRLACAVEDAGFEIRDQIMWLYGSGFPKSHNLTGDWDGWGTALKPAHEPIVVARKPVEGTVAANVLKHGTGALNIDGCRVAAEAGRPLLVGDYKDTDNAVYEGRMDGSLRGGSKANGTTTEGRWPANVLHDGSDEVLAAFPEARGQIARAAVGTERRKTNNTYGAMARGSNGAAPRLDIEKSAARFFYCAKASKAERAGSKHPTVKPIALMRYLVRLVTPPGGTVLDPFAGTGTTGAAAVAEGAKAILIERDPEYAADARRRLGLPQEDIFA